MNMARTRLDCVSLAERSPARCSGARRCMPFCHVVWACHVLGSKRAGEESQGGTALVHDEGSEHAMEPTLLSRLGVLLSVGALLALALVSCDGSTSFASAARTPLRAESATPAMTATPTSAVTSSPTTVELAMPDLTPASSAGWATYRDRRFGFALPVPPGWQP